MVADLIADVANTWPSEPIERTITDATTTTKSTNTATQHHDSSLTLTYFYLLTYLYSNWFTEQRWHYGWDSLEKLDLNNDINLQHTQQWTVDSNWHVTHIHSHTHTPRDFKYRHGHFCAGTKITSSRRQMAGSPPNLHRMDSRWTCEPASRVCSRSR